MSNNTTPFVFPISTARKVTPLRQRMIDDMTVRNFAPNTMLCYLKQVSYFAQYFGKSPDRLAQQNFKQSAHAPARLTEALSILALCLKSSALSASICDSKAGLELIKISGGVG
jgi:hypothetical protein